MMVSDPGIEAQIRQLEDDDCPLGKKFQEKIANLTEHQAYELEWDIHLVLAGLLFSDSDRRIKAGSRILKCIR